jgi:hypothetical protein
MEFESTNPDLIAFIVAEAPITMPDTMEDFVKLAKDPIKRKRMADECANAYCLEDQYIVVYTMDISKNESPKKLCALDILPGNSPSNCEKLETRLIIEKQDKTLTWSSDGRSLFASNRRTIFKIDMAGNKSVFYAISSSETSYIQSNICCSNAEILFLEAVGEELSEFNSRLVRLNKDGVVLSQNKLSKFYGGLNPFDESLPALVDTSRIACSGPREDFHEFYLKVVSFPPYTDDWNERRTRQVFNDPNDVFFGYHLKAFVPNTDELLVLKWRVCWTYKNALTKETPWTLENSAAPWVELRKVKIG